MLEFLHDRPMHSTFAHSAGGVVIGPQGRVLVVQQKDGTWSLPKGHLQEGEDPRDAAIREILEETGIRDIQPVKILKSYSRYTMMNSGAEDTHSLKRITMYLFTTTQKDLYPADARIPVAKWMEPREVADVLTHPKDQEFFLEILPEILEYSSVRLYTSL